MKIKEQLLESLEETCKNLSSRYKNTQEKEDLFQEGFLAGLELIESGEEVSTLDLFYVARKAMGNYYNIRLKPVSLPASGDARSALARIKRGDIPEELEGNQRLLYAALVGDTDGVEENTLKTNPEDAYAVNDLYQKVLDLIIKSDT